MPNVNAVTEFVAYLSPVNPEEENFRTLGTKKHASEDFIVPEKTMTLLEPKPIDLVVDAEIAKKENINAIVTFASELPLKIISKVCKKMNFPNLEEKVIENVINKSKSKKLFLKNNIPHVKGHSFNFNEKKNIFIFFIFYKKNKKKKKKKF